MLDKRMTAVLSMLAENVGYNFKVVKKQQLVDALPKKLNIDTETFVSIIAFLRDDEFLTVKYQDKDEICLSLSVKAESYLSGEQEAPAKTKIAHSQAWILVACSFVASFFGALIATLIGKLF